MRCRLRAVAVLFVMGSGSAFAADLPSRYAAPPVMPVPVFTWTGFYIGVQGGYVRGRTSGPFTAADGTDPSPYRINANGGVVGGHAGYNWQTGSLVFGVEGDANFTDLRQGQIVPDPPVVYKVTAKQNYDADIRGRVGWAFDRVLLYAAGGVAFGDVQTAYTEYGFPPYPYLTKTTDRVGWTIGGGVEYALTNNWLARVEYRHTDLGASSFVNSNPAIDTADSVRFSSDIVLAGISYKFW